jgi:carbamoyl-phosphate synthase large subunit
MASNEPTHGGANRTLSVLVFPGGSEIGLEINRALRDCKEVQLFSAGTDAPNHAPYVFERHFTIPSIHQPDWIRALNRIVEACGIDYIYPAYDDVLLALARSASSIGARIVTSPLRTCEITRSKLQTYRHLAGKIPVPRVFDSPQDVDRFPIFVKPERGQGTERCHAVDSAPALVEALTRHLDLMILEYLPGEEFTVDCFSDRERGLLFCAGRERIRTRSGISTTSRSADNPAFAEFARRIAGELEFHGAWFFQVKRDDAGEFKLLEVAPRIAGTMALSRVLGVNFPLLSLYEQERIPVTIRPHALDVTIDRALTNRYRHGLKYSAVYVDLDDTLVLRGRVNTDLVRFLYQCVNRGVRLVLVTRHRQDVGETLRRHRLAGLFDEVIHITEADRSKAEFIREADAIFIDDSFRERQEVEKAKGILSFNSCMVEMLFDDRG